jgi:hypothetical protein
MAANPTMISLGAIAALVSATAAVPVQASTLTQWWFDPASAQLEVTVPAGVTPRTFLLAQPTRIVMDLPNTDVGMVSAGQVYSGPVRQVRVSQFQPGLTRIVMELSPDATLAPEQVQLQQVGPASGGQSLCWSEQPSLRPSLKRHLLLPLCRLSLLPHRLVSQKCLQKYSQKLSH